MENVLMHLSTGIEKPTAFDYRQSQGKQLEALAFLASGIAHDFNNLLQTILSYTQMAMTSKKEGAVELALSQIEKAVSKGNKIAGQLYNFGHKMKPSLGPVHLNSLILDLMNLFKINLPEMVDVNLSLSDDLWAIEADAGQIEQALLNLCINSRQAMPNSGRLAISTENKTLKKDRPGRETVIPKGNYVRVTVSDTGHGIPPRFKDKIFAPFFTTKAENNGTGLGLPMVFAIVKQHGGYVTCQSQVGMGTSISLFLPAPAHLNTSAETFPQNRRFMLGAGNQHVLVVDDDPDMLSIGQMVLDQSNYRLSTASTGEDAIESYRSDRADLVILDLNLPGMGGIACLKKLLALDKTANILVASGYSANDQDRKAIRLGARGFLSKPYRARQLLGSVSRLLANPQPA